MNLTQPEKKAPEKKQKSSLELTVERTASDRDEVTNNLVAELIPANKSAFNLIVDACKFAGFEEPKQGDKLAPFIYKLQKQVCKFREVDNKYGCDGKLGPITFAALMKAIPQLQKGYSKTKRTEFIKLKKRDLAQSVKVPSSLPVKTPDALKKPAKQTETHEAFTGAISPEETALIGDSLTVGYGRAFYKGTGKYKEYSGELFRGGRSIITMRRRLERYCPDAKAYVVGAAANDIYYKSVNRLEEEFKKMIAIIKQKNPNAKIVLLTLHGDKYSGWRKKQSAIVGKIEDLNTRLRNIARADSNIKLIDIRTQINIAEEKGTRVLAGDKLHYNFKGAKAVASLIKDELQTGTHRKLTDYMG